MKKLKNKPHFHKDKSWQLFDEIAPRYDLLNRLLSFGLDIRWRKQLGQFLPCGEHLRLMDLATGTADVIIYLMEKSPRIARSTGIDLSQGMLKIGQEKINRKSYAYRVNLKHGDAADIPADKESFDCVTIAFGIRNLPQVTAGLKEMHRILANKGRALILEFSLPQNRLIRAVHLFYLRKVVPCLGGFISGHYKAYRYLNETIEDFPYGNRFCRLMTDAGFKHVYAHPLLFGIATIYQGEK